MNPIAQRLRSLAARTALDGIAEEMRAIADEIAPDQQAQEPVPDLNPEDIVVDVVLKQLGGFAPVTTHGIRVTHKPSRVSVVVDSERSQHQNRQLALEMLRAIIHHQAHPVPAPVDERAEFEACAPMAGSLFKRRADDPDKYWDGNVQDDWELWQARAALQSQAPQADGWLPIETAPRGSGENGPRSVNDPSYVKPPDLLLIHPEGISVGYYDWYYHPGYGVGASPYEPVWRSRPDGEGLDGVTHWQPLPPAPQTKGQP